MTPLNLTLFAQGYAEAHSDKYRVAVTGAYYTAMLERQKRMPSLKSLLAPLDGKYKPKKEQSPEEMLAVVQVLHSAIKGRRHGNIQ